MTQASPDRIRAWIEIPASWGDAARRLLFRGPVSEWQADRLEQVRPALERVEAEQQSGHYVIGFLSYEAAPACDAALTTPPKGVLPYAWFAAFDGPSTSGPDQAAANAPTGRRGDALVLRTSEADYLTCVEQALAHIRAGDIYQVNYTVRAEWAVGGDPLDLFRERLAAVSMPHAAYMEGAGWAIVSLSPELFLRRRGRVIESRPMKGTAARHPDWYSDEAARRRLAANPKERAENTMIVDLVRNDLGRICRSGSVHVPELCRVSRHPTVHQMTSLVRGGLTDGVSLWDIFAATFPPGSVTGAPKVRAMEIIRSLEPEPRGVYCGTVGLFFPGGDFELNVAIRTLEIQNPNPKGQIPKADSGRAGTHGSAAAASSLILHPSSLGLGSGIVADSIRAAEWRETLLKGQFLTAPALPEFALIETLAWTPRAGFRNLHPHLRRLRRSADYFGWVVDVAGLVEQLRRITPPSPPVNGGELRVRILLTRAGVKVQTAPLDAWPEHGLNLRIYDREWVDPESVFFYHKTTERGIYDRAFTAARGAGADEAALLNSYGEVTETTRANLFVKLNGEWLTPALTCGLLPGIYRERWLAEGQGREAVITRADLLRAEQIVVANSARGEIGAKLESQP